MSAERQGGERCPRQERSPARHTHGCHPGAMTDLPAVPLEPSDEDDGGVWTPDGDPWPRRCEALAAVLAVVLAFLILGAALVAAGIPLGGVGPSGQTAVPVADRLRFAAQNVSPFDGLVALAAVLLVALDGITSGERRAASTAAGKLAIYAVAVMSLIVSVAAAARFIDVLAGHVDLSVTVPGHVVYRLGIALPQGATFLLASAACWLAFRTWGDGDNAEIDLEMEMEMEMEGFEWAEEE
jgi:hypothetical protein